MSTWGKISPFFRLVLTSCRFFYSNNRNGGGRFLPVQKELHNLIIRKQERPLQPEPVLGSCRQLLGNRRCATERPARDLAASPHAAAAREQPESWQLSILQLPRTSRVCPEVAVGHVPQTNECRRTASRDITVRPPAVGGGGCKVVAHSRTYTTCTHIYKSWIAF